MLCLKSSLKLKVQESSVPLGSEERTNRVSAQNSVEEFAHVP